MDITDWREKIDEIDRDLVRLLNERARCVMEIGRIKRDNKLPIEEPHREQQVLRNALVTNRGPLSSQAMERVFAQIVEEGRQLQRELFESAEPQSPAGSQLPPKTGR